MKILYDFFLVSLADAEKFEQVAIYSKSCLPGESLPRLLQITGGEIDNFAAVRANQVVMMPRSTDYIAVAAISGV